MLSLVIDRNPLTQRMDDAVHAHPGIAAGALALEKLFVRLLPAGFNGGKQQHPSSLTQGQYPLDDLIAGLGADRRLAGRAIGLTDARPENAHEVVDFRDRPDRRTRRFTRVLLLDADSRAQAVHVIDLRRLQPAQELPCIRAERFHIAPLALRVHGVDGEAALAAAAGPATDGHLAARHFNGDVLQVVLFGADDGNHVLPPPVRSDAHLRPNLPVSAFGRLDVWTFGCFDVENVLKHSSGVRSLGSTDVLRRAGRHDSPAAFSTLGSQVDHPIRRLDDVQIVFDDDDGVARVHEPVQDSQQLFDVREMQTGRRLVQQVQRASRGRLDQFSGQLDPLGLTAGERRRGLAELHVIEAHVVQRPQHAGDFRNRLEMLERLLHVHVEHVGDALALV